MRSPRLNTQQVIFWPTVQTIQNLPVPSPNSVSPRQISSGGDPLRFLGSGYPPRQMLTARKGADGVEDPVSSYIPAEVNCMRPLTTKVFGPPKVIARPVVQDPKRSNPIIRSFSGVVAKEVAESPRADTSPGAEAPAASPATTTPATPATPSTPAMAAMVTTAGPSPAPAMVPPSSSPSVPGVPAVVANPNPEAMKGSKSMPPAKVMESPPVSVHQEPIRLRWPIGSSTPTLSTPSVLVWHGYASGRQGTVVPSPKLQPRRVALGSPEGSPAASEGDGKPLKEPTKEDSTEGQDVTDGTSGPSGLKERPSGTLGTIGTFSTGTPITTPRELADRFMAGTYTPPPPHFQMFRSTSTQPDMRPTSPHGRLGVTVRNLSPQTRGAGGALISPSPLSFSSRQPPVPRRSGSPLSSKALADLHSPAPTTVASPMTRQRTLPGHLQPERSATKILTAPVAPSLEVQGSRSSVAPELTSEKPPARAVGEGRASEIHRRRCWRRPSNPAIPHRPTEAPGISHDGNDFTPAVMRLQEKLGYLAEEGTVSL